LESNHKSKASMAFSAEIRVVEVNIISLLMNKDQRGMEFLYDLYGNVIYGFLFQVLQSDELAEDTLEEVFMRVWRSIETFDPKKKRLFTWIVNIARQTAMVKIKQYQLKSLNNICEKSLPAEHYNPESAGIKELVIQLDKKQRHILEEIYFKGVDYKELAHKTELPSGNLKSMVRSVLKMLQISPLEEPKQVRRA
jgi:RNA polymerase sigma-70 factor, ECF subfamily